MFLTSQRVMSSLLEKGCLLLVGTSPKPPEVFHRLLVKQSTCIGESADRGRVLTD